MPDLVTHLSIAYFIKYLFQEIRNNRFFFYIGTVLPDITTRPFYILFPNAYWFVFPMHSVLGILLAGILFALLFGETLRKRILISVYAGSYLHIVIDSFQKDIFREYFWLYPFSRIHLGLDLFPIDDSLKVAPILIITILVFELCIWRRDIFLRKLKK